MLHEKIETTEARAKEVKAIADSLISLAVKEKDNFEMVDVKVFNIANLISVVLPNFLFVANSFPSF